MLAMNTVDAAYTISAITLLLFVHAGSNLSGNNEPIYHLGFIIMWKIQNYPVKDEWH
jgi:hypothetical protein